MARIHEALVAIVREVEPISKDSENRAQGYRFRGVEAVVGMIQPLLAKHGVVMLPRVLDADHDTYPTVTISSDDPSSATKRQAIESFAECIVPPLLVG